MRTLHRMLVLSSHIVKNTRKFILINNIESFKHCQNSMKTDQERGGKAKPDGSEQDLTERVNEAMVNSIQ